MSEKSLETSKIKEPFFSICIEAFNRGPTIHDTLKSLHEQSFKDFEVIVVDNKSTDETLKQILSAMLEFPDLPILLGIIGEHLNGVKAWNEALRLAKGKYVLMLEGDDRLKEEHLNHAYECLLYNQDVGVWFTGKKFMHYNDMEFFDRIYSMSGCPAPSQSIFIRADRNGEPFLFNDELYEYAPEMDLFIRIALNGYHAVEVPYDTVIRSPSIGYKTLPNYFHDSYIVISFYSLVASMKKAKRIYGKILIQDIIMKVRLLCKNLLR